MIYHIMTSTEWERVGANPYYSPDTIARNGFIHCCELEQLEYVGEHWFRGRQDLVILCIDAGIVSAPIKNEDLNSEGMSFPHIYGVLNTNAIKKVVAFRPRSDGTFGIPSEIE